MKWGPKNKMMNNINCIAKYQKLASRTADSMPSEVHDDFMNPYHPLHLQSKGRWTEWRELTE
jgi:hypothetical protein